jgi:large subunit ribosomal protein L37Ae
MTTKKAGSAGRFGARYGSKIRKLVRNVEKQQKARQECPVCRTGTVKRLAKGIYQCRKCSAKIAGKAYTLK